MTYAFKCGFIDKMNQIKKAESTPLKEIFGSTPSHAVLGPASASLDEFGSLAGLFSGYDDESEDDYNDGRYNLIPGYGQYLLNQRRGITTRKMKELAEELGEKDKRPMANNVAEILAPILQAGVGAGAGAALAGRGNRLAGVGAGAGAVALARLIGNIAGISRKRRTDREQLDKETKARAIAKYLIPGISGYDEVLRIGKSRDYTGKNSKKKKKDKKD